MDSDSDFYGDEDEVRGFESRLEAFDPASYWRSHSLSVSASPAKSVKQESSSPAPATTMHNPYEGRTACAYQLSETIEAFLSRLPPSTTDISPSVPWIYIANPYIRRQDRGGEEAPEEFGAQVAKFKEGGEARLEILGDSLREVQEKTVGGQGGKAGPSKAAVNREIAEQREECVNDLLMLAKMLKVRTGKWMLFIEPAYVDDIWATVARATFRHELGISARVAPREHRGATKPRIISIYTYDFSDRDDVARVLNRMKQLGLVRIGPGRKQIYYKPDAYTHLGIGSDNPWNLRASIYSSNDIFAYIKEREGKVLEKMDKRENGSAALEKMIKEEDGFDGGGWAL